MFTLTADNNTKTTSKFGEVLCKREGPHDPNHNLNAYQDLVILRQLNKGKFSIYLVSSRVTMEHYAMKIFSYAGEEPQFYYQNEIRFASLKHPNVIDIVHHEDEKGITHKNKLKKISYILIEYAPYGDFFDFLSNFREEFDDKLVRTYFRQLIEGLEYLHASGVAHLDLKPENLLLGADFNLKIADFDLSHIDGDAMIMSSGTVNYRAPEFFQSHTRSGSTLEQLFAADIYSAGVILFVLKSGMYPHAENKPIAGVRFMDLMYNENQEFWVKHCEVQHREESFFCNDFKELFNGMVKADPKERLTIQQIKASMWYNGPVYTPSELTAKMQSLYY